MLTNKYVDEYYRRYESGELVLNEKRIQLLDFLKREILSKDDEYYFNEDQINDYITFSETWYFELDEWEKFIAPFVFLYKKSNDFPVFRIFIIILGRGAGKNGFISTIAHFLSSSLHGVPEYDVSIVANSEYQAKTSFEEIYNKIIKSPDLSAIRTQDTMFEDEPVGEFEPRKSIITSKETQAKIMFHTSNARTKDGGREGALIFDEFHEYEDSQLVDVFTGGLGKKPNPRQFFLGTKGFLREAYFDMYYQRVTDILDGSIPFNGIFPYVAELDDLSEMDNEEMWPKANPALQEPLSQRAETLLETVRDEYFELAYQPSKRPAFVTKRMNFVEGDMEHSVASKRELNATRRPFFDFGGLKPIGGLDFGSVRDFASCGLLFKKNLDYAFKQHSFVIKNFVDVHYGYSNSANQFGGGKKAPIKKWEQDGHLSVMDEPSLNPMHIVDWFVEARELYGVEKIIADNYKLDILRPLLETEGFEVEAIRRPSSIHPLLAPRIEDGFANNKFIFADDDMMRWYTYNVYVKETDAGKQFMKKEEVKRKTDGFQAFVHALYRANELEEGNVDDVLDFLDNFEF